MPRESTIQIYRSTIASSVPSLTAGEMAVNIADKRLFVGGTSGNLVFRDETSSVTSVNGLTGAITNVAKTNIDNGFTLRQSISDNLATNQVTVGGASIDFYYGVSENTQTLISSDSTSSISLPSTSGTLALVDGVATRVNGATGAITITGAGAILFTHSGKTGTFNARLASASTTGVASFGNEFTVSAAGAVSLTANYVKSINGSTGAVVSIATTGANTFTGLQTMNGGLTTNHLYVSNGATFNSRATFAGGLTTANLLVSNGATFNSSVFCNTGLSAYNLDILNYQSEPKFDVNGIQIGDVYGVDTGAKVVADFAANYFQFVGCDVIASQIYSNNGTLNIQTQGSKPTVNIGDYNVNNNGTCIKIDDNFSRVDINAVSDVFIGNIFEPPSSYLRLDNNTKTTTFSNTSISGGDAKFGGIMTLNGGLSAGSGVTFGGRPSFMGGLSANNLYVSQGVTFNSTSVHTGLGTFNGGITSNNLYVSQGVTFAGTVISDTGYRISSSAINAQTGTSYTLTGTDNGKVVTFDNSSAVTVTIPTGLPVGFNCTAIQLGAGQVGFTNAAGLTMQSYGNQYKLLGQHASATIIEYTTNIVNVSGNLTI